jgi:ABC-type sugar transport system ATPase subunit
MSTVSNSSALSSFTKEIESCKKDKFFEASAVATILEEVRNKSFVVITGPSGIGKSTIVKLVALQLQKTVISYFS